MIYRTFGRMGWRVSEIGYGMWGMGGWTESDDAESLRSLQLSVELGCNFFDTAWAYGAGHSERLLGTLLRKALQPARASASRQKTVPRHKDSTQEPQMALTARYHPGRRFSRRLYQGIYRTKFEKPRHRNNRPSAVSCLGRRLGTAGRMAARH